MTFNIFSFHSLIKNKFQSLFGILSMERAFYESWIFGKGGTSRQKAVLCTHMLYSCSVTGQINSESHISLPKPHTTIFHLPAQPPVPLRLYFPALHHSRGCVITFLTSYSMPGLFLFSRTTPQPVKALCVCVTLQVCEEREEGNLPVSRAFQLLVSDRQQRQRRSHPAASRLAGVGGRGVAWQWADGQDGWSGWVGVRARVMRCVVRRWDVAAVHTVACDADGQRRVAALQGHVARACEVMLHMHIHQEIQFLLHVFHLWVRRWQSLAKQL